MGRVVRGMGAMGWEGASDMAAACVCVQLGDSEYLATAIGVVMCRLVVLLMLVAQRSLTSAAGLARAAATGLSPQKVYAGDLLQRLSS